jgi:FKBP-type peptidyl-prolyl cis-trans isomerase
MSVIRISGILAASAVLVAGVWAAEPATPTAAPGANATMPTTQAAAGTKWVTASGIAITEDRRGEAGAQNGDMLFVHYRGTLDNGKEFDSSYSRNQPFRLTKLGAGQVIKGWDEGLLGMIVGEKRKLVIPPALAYGESGKGDIPKNATLTFEVELVGLVRVPEGK